MGALALLVVNNQSVIIEFEDGLDFTSRVIGEARGYPDYAIATTGHSLGGGHAQISAYTYNLDGITFDAPQASKVVESKGYQTHVKALGVDPAGPGNTLINYTEDGSPVSADIPGAKYIGTEKELNLRSNAGYALPASVIGMPIAPALLLLNEIKNQHTLDNFIEYFNPELNAALNPASDQPLFGAERKLDNAANAAGLEEGSVAEGILGALGAGFGAMQNAAIGLGSLMGALTGLLGFGGGMPASKHFDITLGIDVHPFPPLFSVPFPAPYIGIVFDPFEYLAELGSLLSAVGATTVGGVMSALGGTIKVNGIHKTMAGSMSMNIPHIPWVALNQGEVFMGSSTVLAEGEPFTYGALPVLSCWIAGIFAPFRMKPKKSFSPMLPTTIVIPLPLGRPVVVGGPPTISFMNLFMSGLFKMFGKAFKALKKRIRKFNDTHCLKCIAGSAMRLFGNPVDIATGQKVVIEDDVSIDATLPLTFTRVHYGGRTTNGYLGSAWFDNWSEYITLEDDKVIFHTAMARTINFDDPGIEGVECSNIHAPQNRLRRKGERFTIFNNNQGLIKTFARIDDERYRLIKMEDANGNAVQFFFTRPTKKQPRAHIKRLVHSDGFELRVKTNPKGWISCISMHAPDIGETPLVDYSYDALGHLQQISKPSGYYERYSYNDKGYIIKNDYCGDYEATYIYNQNNRVIECQTTTEFNNDRLIIDDKKRQCTHIDSLGRQHVYIMDEHDQPVIEQDPAGNVIRNTWGNVDQLLQTEDQIGRITQYAYDDWGQVTEITFPDEKKAVFTRDENGRLLGFTSPAGNRWSFAYDEKGNLIEETSPDGQTWRYERRADGLAERVIRPGGAVTHLEYNARKQLSAVIEWNGTRTEMDYNPFGKLLERRDPDGSRTRYEYDRGGNLSMLTLADGRCLGWKYDHHGNVTSFTDGQGRTTRYEYGAYDTLNAITDPLGKKVLLERDALMRLASVINEAGETYRFQYDMADNLVKETDFAGHAITYTHDAAGQIISSKTSGGKEQFFSHDILGRLIEQRTATHKEGGIEKITRLGYDDNGLLSRASDGRVNVAFRRDKLGRISEEILEIIENDKTIRKDHVAHEYDALGNHVAQTFNGAKTRYGYDTDGFMREFAPDGHAPLAFQRDPLGRERRRFSASGFAQEMRFDSLGQLTTQTAGRLNAEALATFAEPETPHNAFSSLIPSFSGLGARREMERHYAYDKAFNPIEIADSRFGKTHYEYDARDQIIRAHYESSLSGGLREERFHYDARRNLAGMQELPAAPLEAAAERAIKAFHKNGAGGRIERRGNTTYAYDGEGRLVSKRVDQNGFRPQVWKYTWDESNQLTRVTTPDGAIWAYDYDPLGRRIAKRCLKGGRAKDMNTVAYLWNGNQLSAERRRYADGREVAVDYHYEDATSFVPLAQVVNGKVQYIVTDHLGTPRELFNEEGRLIWAERRKVWGALESAWPVPLRADNDNDNLIGCSLRFQGQIEDCESGLYYNRFRYYNPDEGCYISPDPIGLLGGLRAWGYVDNPSTWIDPFGLSDEYFRGAKLDESVNFEPRAHDYKIDKNTGLVKTTHGVSVFSNADKVVKNGFVPHKVSSIPDNLEILQRGKDLEHFEIVPKKPMSVDEYKEALQKLEAKKVDC